MTDLLTKLALTYQETLENTINCLSSHISLETRGAFDIESLFKILVRAASCGATIEQTAKELKNVPSSNNIRYHHYGEPTPEERPYIYRSQAKNGTCYFYAYAALYLVKKGNLSPLNFG